MSKLSSAEFSNDWTDKPFIMTDVVKEWPAYSKWSEDNLLQQYRTLNFRAEAVDWPLEMYVDYMNNNQDESPLYLFDRSFVHTMNLGLEKDSNRDFWIPECFGEDLFTLLGEQRPDHQWLIIGPERSGSTFHKDPNATRSIHSRKGDESWISNTSIVHGTLFCEVQNTGSCFLALRLAPLLLEFSFQMIRVKSPAL